MACLSGTTLYVSNCRSSVGNGKRVTQFAPQVRAVVAPSWQAPVLDIQTAQHSFQKLSTRRLVAVGASAPTNTATDASASATSDEPSILRVDLPGDGLDRALMLEVMGDGGKGQAIVVVGVLEGSAADKAGIEPGMRLLTISDPVRYNEMFALNDRPSLRFVRDTVRMRRGSKVAMEFQRDFIKAAPPPPVTAPPPKPAESSLGTLGTIDDLIGEPEAPEADADGTIGDQLATRYEASLKAAMENNEVQKRIKRRKERMELDDARDDTGFFLGVFATFVLPPLVILVIAYSSGYLDSMYLTSLAGFKG